MTQIFLFLAHYFYSPKITCNAYEYVYIHVYMHMNEIITLGLTMLS